MIFRLLGLFLVFALGGVLAQDELPGVFGKIVTRSSAGDLAPEIRFSKVLSGAGSAAWTSASLSGRVTVLLPFPYVSGNPHLVNQWNALVESFSNKPIQFAWIAGEREDTLLPFLKKHPLKGWVFSDLEGATGRAYGLEQPEAIIIGADRRIVGFDRSGPVPSQELVNEVLSDRITIAPPKPTFQQLRAFSENGQLLLWPEPQRMSRAADYRPDFAPSYALHITPTHDSQNGGNYGGPDYWNLQGYTLPMLLSEVLGVNPIRIDLPASVDTKTRYDFAIVLPKPEDRESMRSLIRQGVQDYFHLVETSENRLTDVYLLTSSDKKPPASSIDRNADDGFESSSSIGFIEVGGPDGLPTHRAHSIDALTNVRANGATVDEFCSLLESELDRPVVNETGLDGRFDLEVSEPSQTRRELSRRDFVERIRDQLGLVITAEQRNVETIVYRRR